SKILIFGATGYLGKYLIKASISMGHQTYAFVRRIKSDTNPSKIQHLKDFESIGGELDEYEKLIPVLKEVDVVISALAVPQHLDQLKIISAMKEAGNIKRFVPSEFGNEVDRVSGVLPPFQKLLDNKKIRRATEEAVIPFTYVSANSFAAYFVDYLLHPHDSTSDDGTLYGDGEAKAVLNYEDFAIYTVKAATDPKVANRVIIYRTLKNVVSQLDLVAAWEKKTRRTIHKNHIPEQEIINVSQKLPFPDNVPVAILHNIFIAGAQLSFELTDDDLEASELYPEHKYTSVDDLLNRCLVDPPKLKLAAFA
ncbi:hypothetical protein ACP275_08G086100, partial [Erythranthe tilingii]